MCVRIADGQYKEKRTAKPGSRLRRYDLRAEIELHQSSLAHQCPSSIMRTIFATYRVAESAVKGESTHQL